MPTMYSTDYLATLKKTLQKHQKNLEEMLPNNYSFKKYVHKKYSSDFFEKYYLVFWRRAIVIIRHHLFVIHPLIPVTKKHLFQDFLDRNLEEMFPYIAMLLTYLYLTLHSIVCHPSQWGLRQLPYSYLYMTH